MDRTGKIIRILKKKYPSAVTALAHKDPLELLVATICRPSVRISGSTW
jgi:endonuclease III